MSNISLAQFAAVMQHDEAALLDNLKRDAILQPDGTPYRGHVNRGYFLVGELGGKSLGAMLTSKGQIWLARKYPQGCALGAAK
jgi:hypothetical protein